MTLPASTLTPQDAFKNANNTAVHLKAHAQQLVTASAAGSTNRELYLGLWQALGSAIGIWTAAAAVPGIQGFARDQFDNQALDYIAELNATTAAAVTLRDWINNNFPKHSPSNALLYQTADTNGLTTPLTFSSAQLADFRTQANVFIATIG